MSTSKPSSREFLGNKSNHSKAPPKSNLTLGLETSSQSVSSLTVTSSEAQKKKIKLEGEIERIEEEIKQIKKEQKALDEYKKEIDRKVKNVAEQYRIISMKVKEGDEDNEKDALLELEEERNVIEEQSQQYVQDKENFDTKKIQLLRKIHKFNSKNEVQINPYFGGKRKTRKQKQKQKKGTCKQKHKRRPHK